LDKIIILDKDEWWGIWRRSKIELLKRLFAFKKEIQEEKFDIIFDLSLKSSYGFFFKMTGIKTRIGFNFKNRGRSLTHKIDLPQGFSNKHVARYYLDLLKFLDIQPHEYKYDLFVSNQSIEEAKRILRNYHLDQAPLVVGVCPAAGDSWGNTAYFRRWPKDNFITLCRRLTQELGAKIILFGSKNEVDVCSYISDNLPEGKPLSLCGNINLDNFVAMLAMCNLVVTNDGGPFHIAQALDKKAIGFIGPMDERVYGTYPESALSAPWMNESTAPILIAAIILYLPSQLAVGLVIKDLNSLNVILTRSVYVRLRPMRSFRSSRN
jgi:ADP-heptose:LPS heptosyltransferase